MVMLVRESDSSMDRVSPAPQISDCTEGGHASAWYDTNAHLEICHCGLISSIFLCTATHMFIHCDAVRKPLQPPYDGPYPTQWYR
jgi:hypothetical protein